MVCECGNNTFLRKWKTDYCLHCGKKQKRMEKAKENNQTNKGEIKETIA